MVRKSSNTRGDERSVVAVNESACSADECEVARGNGHAVVGVGEHDEVALATEIQPARHELRVEVLGDLERNVRCASQLRHVVPSGGPHRLLPLADETWLDPDSCCDLGR